jgi:hypothetical protein
MTWEREELAAARREAERTPAYVAAVERPRDEARRDAWLEAREGRP